VTSSVYRHQARILLHAPAARVREKVPPTWGSVEEVDADHSLLTSGSDNLEVLAAYLGLLGCDFEVREPPELRRVVDELAGRLVRSAASG